MSLHEKFTDYFCRNHPILNRCNFFFFIGTSSILYFFGGVFGISYGYLHFFYYITTTLSITFYVITSYFSQAILTYNFSQANPFDETKSQYFIHLYAYTVLMLGIYAHILLVLNGAMEPIFILDYIMPILYGLLDA